MLPIKTWIKVTLLTDTIINLNISNRQTHDPCYTFNKRKCVSSGRSALKPTYVIFHLQLYSYIFVLLKLLDRRRENKMVNGPPEVRQMRKVV